MKSLYKMKEIWFATFCRRFSGGKITMRIGDSAEGNSAESVVIDFYEAGESRPVNYAWCFAEKDGVSVRLGQEPAWSESGAIAEPVRLAAGAYAAKFFASLGAKGGAQ